MRISKGHSSLRVFPISYVPSTELRLITEHSRRRKSISRRHWRISQTVAFEKAHFKSPKAPKRCVSTENQQTRRLCRDQSRAERPSGPRVGPGPRPGPRRRPRPGLAAGSRPRPGLGPGPRAGLGPRPEPRPRPRARPRAPAPAPPPAPAPAPGPAPGPGPARAAPGRALAAPWRGPLGTPKTPDFRRCPYRPLISYKIGGMPTKTLGP